MTPLGQLRFDAALAAYEREAHVLLTAFRADDESAAWCIKWEHPAFRGSDVADVRAATLVVDDARTVIARVYGCEDWPHLVAFCAAVAGEPPVARFERAADAVVDGEIDALRTWLRSDLELARERSRRRHHATLLHYVAANGVEGMRQKTPSNIVEIATLLLDAGAEPDALADMYDQRCTTMSMLVSSAHPARAGLQVPLARLLLARGARLRGPGTAWQSAVGTALAFGYLDTARALADAAALDDLVEAAGLGSTADVERLLPGADAAARHAALAMASMHGHADIVRRLLDAGENPDRFNPQGLHAHATPLHQAALHGHLETVRVLAERGARLDLRDAIYHATPLGWAEHGRREDVAQYLRERGGA